MVLPSLFFSTLLLTSFLVAGQKNVGICSEGGGNTYKFNATFCEYAEGMTVTRTEFADNGQEYVKVWDTLHGKREELWFDNPDAAPLIWQDTINGVKHYRKYTLTCIESCGGPTYVSVEYYKTAASKVCARKAAIMVMERPLEQRYCVPLCPAGIKNCRGNLLACTDTGATGQGSLMYTVGIWAKLPSGKLFLMAADWVYWGKTKSAVLVVETADFPICPGGYTDGVAYTGQVVYQVNPSTNKEEIGLVGSVLCDAKIGAGQAGCQTSNQFLKIKDFFQ